MLVSDLIKFRDDFIDNVNALAVDQSIRESCDKLNLIISRNTGVIESVSQEKINQAVSQITQLGSQYSLIKEQLLSTITDINQQIDQLSPTVHTSPDTPYKKRFKAIDNKISYDHLMSADIEQTIISRIRLTSDWHFPGLQLGCRNEKYTAELVSCDPLYFCDFDMSYIDRVSGQFNDVYNRRLRKYQLLSSQFDFLPQNQFGIIFSWMFFNFAELAEIQIYLSELFKILRPGGVLIFSYNNGDIVESARIFESGIMSFVPKRNLISICRDIGFEIIESFDFINEDNEIKTISWIEIRKPGTLQTVKRSQARGQILTK